MPVDDLALLAQVREALDARCGCGTVACYDAVSGAPHMVKLRDCPTCLPERISAAIEAGQGRIMDAVAALRGER